MKTKKIYDKWKSKNGTTVSHSGSHPGMYIVDFPDGKFFTINSTFELISQSYPVKKVIQ